MIRSVILARQNAAFRILIIRFTPLCVIDQNLERFDLVALDLCAERMKAQRS